MTEDLTPQETLTPEQERKLRSIGLETSMLPGKSVLDIHGGLPTFGEKRALCGAKVVEINPEPEAQFDSLPFSDKEFDFVIVTEGDLRGNPWDEEVMDLYKEAIRVIKDNSEIRIYDPYPEFQPTKTSPKGWSLADELRYLLSQQEIDVTAEMVTSSEEPKVTRPYLVVKKNS